MDTNTFSKYHSRCFVQSTVLFSTACGRDYNATRLWREYDTREYTLHISSANATVFCIAKAEHLCMHAITYSSQFCRVLLDELPRFNMIWDEKLFCHVTRNFQWWFARFDFQCLICLRKKTENWNVMSRHHSAMFKAVLTVSQHRVFNTIWNRVALWEFC